MARPGRKSTKANRSGLEQLVQLYEKRDPTNLVWFHKLGRLLKQLKRPDVGLYGRRFIREAAEKLRGKLSVKFLVNELSAARQFVGQFPKRAEVKAIVARARRQRMKFGVTHIRYLLPVADLEKRWWFTEECLKERWTATRLRTVIARDRGDGKTAGRPPAAPKTRIEGLHRLLERSEAWLTRIESLWPVIGEPDPAEKPEDVAKLLREAQLRLQQMATAINDAIPKLLAAEQRAKKAARKGRRRKGSQTPVAEILEHFTDSWLSK